MDSSIRHILTLSGDIFCMLGLKTRHIAMMCMSVLFKGMDLMNLFAATKRRTLAWYGMSNTYAKVFLIEISLFVPMIPM